MAHGNGALPLGVNNMTACHSCPCTGAGGDLGKDVVGAVNGMNTTPDYSLALRGRDEIPLTSLDGKGDPGNTIT